MILVSFHIPKKYHGNSFWWKYLIFWIIHFLYYYYFFVFFYFIFSLITMPTLIESVTPSVLLVINFILKNLNTSNPLQNIIHDVMSWHGTYFISGSYTTFNRVKSIPLNALLSIPRIPLSITTLLLRCRYVCWIWYRILVQEYAFLLFPFRWIIISKTWRYGVINR